MTSPPRLHPMVLAVGSLAHRLQEMLDRKVSFSERGDTVLVCVHGARPRDHVRLLDTSDSITRLLTTRLLLMYSIGLTVKGKRPSGEGGLAHFWGLLGRARPRLTTVTADCNT